MKVVGWTSYEKAEHMQESFGGMGGWFNADLKSGNWNVGHRWRDYLERICGSDKVLRARAEALRTAIHERRLWEPGDWHQDAHDGVPIFDDMTVAAFSYRAWGDLLAAIWSEHFDRDYNYMDFYYGNWLVPDWPVPGGRQ